MHSIPLDPKVVARAEKAIAKELIRCKKEYSAAGFVFSNARNSIEPMVKIVHKDYPYTEFKVNLNHTEITWKLLVQATYNAGMYCVQNKVKAALGLD